MLTPGTVPTPFPEQPYEHFLTGSKKPCGNLRFWDSLGSQTTVLQPFPNPKVVTRVDRVKSFI